MLCPDRDLVGTPNGLNVNEYPPQLNNQEMGYGYNDGWVSDSCLGLTCQVATPNYNKVTNGVTDTDRNMRPGQPIAEITNPADCVAFGDTNDTPGYSIAMDNMLGVKDAPQRTSQMRHNGTYNFAFVDGHAKTIRMEVVKKGSDFLTRPKSETDGLKWCRGENARPDPSFTDTTFINPTGTCAEAVHAIYLPTWVQVP